MVAIPFLRGENIYLRPLQTEDAQGPYLQWFNDEEVSAGTSHHDFPFTIKDASAYIERAQKFDDELILAIALKSDDRHIGNITLKRINYISRTAELAIVIGDKSCWGKGYSKEAARLLLDHAFFTLNLNRIYCGTFETNIPMQKLAEYVGMRIEGRRRQAAFKNNRFLDLIEYGVLREEYLGRFGEFRGK